MPTRHALPVVIAGFLAVAAGSTAAASGPPTGAPAGDASAAVDCAAIADAIATQTDPPEAITTFIDVSEAAVGSLVNSAEPPYTVFIPVNSAFDAIPANVLASIVDDEARVTAVVDYHVIPDVALTAADLAATKEVETALGAPIAVSLDGDTIVLNDGAARVLCSDIDLGGVTLHLIDGVLQPPEGAGGVPGSSVPGGAAFDPDQQAAATAWETAVDSSLTFDEQAPFIENADALRPTIEAYPAAADVVGGITATVTSVEIDGDTATVTYTVSFGGVEAPYGELETSLVRVDGEWMAPQDEYCALQAYARNDCAA